MMRQKNSRGGSSGRWAVTRALALGAAITSAVLSPSSSLAIPAPSDAGAAAEPPPACGEFSTCTADEFVPRADTDALPVVPANAVGLRWYPGYDYDGDPETDGGVLVRTLTLSRVSGESLVEVATYDASTVPGENYVLAQFDEPLTVGARYQLSATPLTGDMNGTPVDCTRTLEFKATAEAPLPTTLGTVTVGEPALISGATGDQAECQGLTQGDAVGRKVTLTLSDEAKPWRDVMYVRALTDGFNPWLWANLDNIPLNSNLSELIPVDKNGVAEVDIFLICSQWIDFTGLGTPGVHTVRFRASFPEPMAGPALTTGEIEVNFNCEDVGLTNPPTDPGFDSGTVFPDDDSGVNPTKKPKPRPVSDCAVRGGPSGGSMGLAWLAFSTFVLARRLRRRSV